ncbi:MAG: hypothetical protein ACRDSJ_21920 [Rubrobacteraceae bacterium]
MGLLSEILIVSGVAMDLVGAVVLSRAHNAESIMEIREEIHGEGRALGEEDEVATHAQLLAEKRAGFFILALGLTLYLVGLILKSPEGAVLMAVIAVSVISVVVIGTMLWVKVRSRQVRKEVREAKRDGHDGDLPEQ